MAALSIPTVYKDKAVLIADDEPEHLEWLVDFLESLGLTVTLALNVEEAMVASQKTWYRIYVVDLNLPLGGWPEPNSSVFSSYPGFTIIQGIRSQGNDGRRVIAYSAHSNDQIAAEMKRLYTDYIAKGRPIQLKERIRELLAEPDQTAATVARINARNRPRKAVVAGKRTGAKSSRVKPQLQPARKRAGRVNVSANGSRSRSAQPKLKKSAKPTK